MRLLLIGPIPPPLGGATVLFNQLVDELAQRKDLHVEVVNTSRLHRSSAKNLVQGFRTLVALLRRIRHTEVVGLHASIRGAALFGPVVSVICYICGRPWIFRGFGGFYPNWYQAAPMPIRWLFRHTVLAADTVLFETRLSVEFFTSITRRPVCWYANSRVLSDIPTRDGTHSDRGARRFVFLGHVSEVKGVRDLIHASRELDGVTIDVYGPITDQLTQEDFIGSGVTYMGVVEPMVVPDLLRGYDVLVLPSRYWAEGYPGAVLEAFSAGIPVIASSIGAIPEIVGERNGILIEPGRIDQLATAIKMLRDDSTYFSTLQLGAKESALQFSSDRWTAEFVRHCRNISRGLQPPTHNAT